MSLRRPLPDRRRNWTQKVRITDEQALQTIYLTVGEYPDGTPGEIFLTAAKAGTHLRGTLDALARVASAALQCEMPLAELVKALRGLNYPPRGPVVGSPAVTDCLSVGDWIARELEAAYLTE